MSRMTNEDKANRQVALMSGLNKEDRQKLATDPLLAIDFLRSIYMDADTPTDIAVAAARAVIPYESRKLPSELNINQNGTPLFDINKLKELSSEELSAFIAMSEKIGLDLSGGTQTKKLNGDIVDVTPELVHVYPQTLRIAKKVEKDLVAVKKKKAKVK